MQTGQTYLDNEVTLVFHSESRTNPPTAKNIQPLFLMRELNEVSLIGEINRLEQNYYQLKRYVSTPAIMQYGELAQLRRHASTPAVSRQWRTQMRLAVELLRLGRREEACWILNAIESRLVLNNEQSAVYGLWLAILKATASDYNGAYATAQHIITLLDNHYGRTVLSFFRSLAQNAAGILGKNNLIYQLPDEE
jgi:hypothetical protein